MIRKLSSRIPAMLGIAAASLTTASANAEDYTRPITSQEPELKTRSVDYATLARDSELEDEFYEGLTDKIIRLESVTPREDPRITRVLSPGNQNDWNLNPLYLEYNFFFQFNEEVRKDLEKMDPKAFNALMYINSTGDPIWQFQKHPGENHPRYERFEDYISSVGGEVIEEIVGKALEDSMAAEALEEMGRNVWKKVREFFGRDGEKDERDKIKFAGGEISAEYSIGKVEDLDVRSGWSDIEWELIEASVDYKNLDRRIGARISVSTGGIEVSGIKMLTPIEQIYDENGEPTGDFYTLGKIPVGFRGKVKYDDFDELGWQAGLVSTSEFKKDEVGDYAREKGLYYSDIDYSAGIGLKGKESDPLGAFVNLGINWK